MEGDAGSIIRPKVLVVEDMFSCFSMINKGFDNKVEVLHADTIETAEIIFQENSDIALIIMDACVPGNKPNTMSLVRKIVESGFERPIIASSSLPPYNDQLVEAGATHASEKDAVAKTALVLLNLQ